MSDNNVKAPSQIFKWFEKMKENYDKNILAILHRFEQNNNLQQNRLDEAHNNHIKIMQANHNQQTEQLLKQISDKEQEITYFKQQVSTQQQSIIQLTNKCDNLMLQLISPSENPKNYKDIFDENDIINIDNKLSDQDTINQSIALNEATKSAQFIKSHNEQTSYKVASELESNCELPLNTHFPTETEALFQQALQMREHNKNEQAFITFKQAATLGHVQAMGALGRAYFLAEGVEENPTLGLAWLINAANLGLPQAVKRVEHFKTNDTKLYQQAILLAQEVASDCLAALV